MNHFNNSVLVVIAFFVMAVAPPLAFIILVGAFSSHMINRSSVRARREEQRMMRKVLVYKSIPS